MSGRHFEGTDFQIFSTLQKDKKIRYDKSGANVHVALVNSNGCENGGLAGRSTICKATPLALCCLFEHNSSLRLAEKITHEIGHVLGKIPSSFILILRKSNFVVSDCFQ